jgi:hypothetical protein
MLADKISEFICISCCDPYSHRLQDCAGGPKALENIRGDLLSTDRVNGDEIRALSEALSK